MDEKNEAHSTDEIEITEAMIEAGALAVGEYDCRFEGPEEAVCRVYVAMARARKLT